MTHPSSQRGATMVEYAVMVALIAIASVFSVKRVSFEVYCAYDTTALVGGGTDRGVDDHPDLAPDVCYKWRSEHGLKSEPPPPPDDD